MAGYRRYDWLVVGAGLAGATFTRHALDHGKRVLVLERRANIAGNCYTERRHGIDVHLYGPHLFHTSSASVWQFVNRFADFNGYHHQVVADTGLGMVSLPINLHTLNQLFGITTPKQAKLYFDGAVEQTIGDDAESWCLRTIGRQLYEMLIYGYTKKHWGREPSTLPSSVVRRLPVRLDWNTRYFRDRYEGIPIDGYTEMVQRMLNGADVVLETDYHQRPRYWRALADKVVYTGAIDELFGFDEGRLEYRSIRLEHRFEQVQDYQGIGQLNQCRLDVPWVRSIEPKHFNQPKEQLPYTIVSTEFSDDSGEPAYPVPDDRNDRLADQYRRRARCAEYLIAGRLATYQYLDMHQVIAQATKLALEVL